MLEGVRVVEWASYVAGPSAGGMLAEWGADVIKIEPASGDPFRKGFEGLTPDGESPMFQLDNRGKRSIVLDVHSENGIEILHRLLEQTDVFLTNVRTPVLERSGLDWGTLCQSYPKLVFAQVTGYGDDGPDRDRPGFDMAAFWARSGAAALMTPKGQDPLPLRTAFGDHMLALALVAGIMTSLFDRTRTGVGRRITTSLLRTGVFAAGSDFASLLRMGRIASTKSRYEALAPLVNYFRIGGERWICLMPRDHQTDWPKIAAVAGRNDLLDDPRFATEKSRRKHSRELIEALDEGFARRSVDDALNDLTSADLVWAPVQSAREVIDDPQVLAAQCFVDVPDGSGGSYRSPSTPATFDNFEPILSPAPRIGEHTEEILSELATRQHCGE